MTNANRYHNGKIYQIINDFNDQVYIGFTCQTLAKRLYSHHRDCKKVRQYNGRLYQLVRSHGGWQGFRIRLVEEFPCENNDQLRQREQHHIDELKQSEPSRCLNVSSAYHNSRNPKHILRQKHKDSSRQHERYVYQCTWGGCIKERRHCNLLQIDPTLFQ